MKTATIIYPDRRTSANPSPPMTAWSHIGWISGLSALAFATGLMAVSLVWLWFYGLPASQADDSTGGSAGAVLCGYFILCPMLGFAVFEFAKFFVGILSEYLECLRVDRNGGAK